MRSQHAVSQALLHELHVLRSTASLRPWAQVDRVLKSSVDFGRTSSSNQLGWQRSYGMQYRAAPMQRSAKDGALGHSASSRKAQMRRLALATELDAGNYLSRLQKERDTRDALRHQESRLRPESIFKAYRNDEPPDARVTSHRRPQSPVRRAAPRAATKPWEAREAAVAAAADRAEHPEATHKQQQQLESQEERREREKIIQMATDSLNSRFATGNMFKAFQSIDLDRNGRLSPVEIRRALELWNLPIDE